MYNTYHLINQEPFLNKPSAELFFSSSAHTRAWEFLLAGIESEEPAVMVTGNYGVGKTVLCLKLVEELKTSNHAHVYVSTPMQSYLEVLWGICSALKIKAIPAASDEDDLHRIIYKYLDRNTETRIVIIVDDVQEHNSKTLNKIRLLANYTREGNYSIRLFLFGSPAFVQRLKAVDMEPLDQRIKRRLELTPLDFEDAKEYIYFRLIHAGAKGSPFFTDDAIHRIVDATGGILRKINNLCDMCLQIGASRGIDDIDAELVNEAIAAMGWEVESPSNTVSTEDKTPVSSETFDTATTTPLQHEEPQRVTLHSEGAFQPTSPVSPATSYPPQSAPEPVNPFAPPGPQHGQQGEFAPSHPNPFGEVSNQAPAKPENTSSPANSNWTAWAFRGVVVFLLLAIFATVVLREINGAG